jgi:hypothetical protein
MTKGGGASAVSTSVVTGGSAGESATVPVGIDAGADNKTGGLGAAAVSTASLGMTAAPIGGLNLGGLPHGSLCRLGPPLEGALRGGQPTSVAHRNPGCRGRPRLKGLRGGQTSRALPPLAEKEKG